MILLNDSKPRVLDFDDYRSYLKDFYKWKKNVEVKYSLQAFAKDCGFSSHSSLVMIMNNERNLSIKATSKVIRGLKLSSQESEYFSALVHLDQAKNENDKVKIKKYLDKIKSFSERKLLDFDKYEYFSKWYYPAIRELINLPSFKEDPKWIAKRLYPPITPEQAEESLELLKRLKVVAKNEQGNLVNLDTVIATPPEIFSEALGQFHIESFKNAIESLYNLSGELRDASAVMFRLKKADIPKIKRNLTEFRQKFLREFYAKEDEGDCVMQLSMALFPVALKLNEDD